MPRSENIIVNGIVEFLVLVLLTLGVPLIVIIDIKFVSYRVGEFSLTEATQEILLLISTLIFFHSVWRYAHSRGFLLLIAGFFSSMLMRELDGILDKICSGCWVWPAIFFAVAAIAYVFIFCRDTIVKPLADFIYTKPYYYMSFGLLVVLIFGQSFGSRSMIWRHAIDTEDSYWIRNILQEGLELFGYIFITYASCLFARQLKNTLTA